MSHTPHLPSWHSRWRIIASLVAAPMLVAPTAFAATVEANAIKRTVIVAYAALAQAVYEDAALGARSLAAAVDALIADPSETSLARARQAWIDSRVPYAQTEAFRFYDGPIDAVEGRINSWPIDENLIDYVAGDG